MRDPARIPVLLEAIRVAWERDPDLRLTQLLVNVLDARPNPLFPVEDDVVLARLQEHLVSLQADDYARLEASGVRGPTKNLPTPTKDPGQRFDPLEGVDECCAWVNEAPEEGWDRVAVCAVGRLPNASLRTPWLGRPAVIFELKKRSDIDRVVRELLSNPHIRLLVIDPERCTASPEAELVESALITLWREQQGVDIKDSQGVLSDIVKHLSTTWDLFRDVKLVLGKPGCLGQARLGEQKLPGPRATTKREPLHLTQRQFPPTPVEPCPMCLPPLTEGMCPEATYDRATGAMSRCRKKVHDPREGHDDGCLYWGAEITETP